IIGSFILFKFYNVIIADSELFFSHIFFSSGNPQFVRNASTPHTLLLYKLVLLKNRQGDLK
ncbi:MAG: hypothetical protein ACR2O0_03290, partial [Rhizobiaceae bacterium]